MTRDEQFVELHKLDDKMLIALMTAAILEIRDILKKPLELSKEKSALDTFEDAIRKIQE